jgi:hypothetical protein
VYHQGSSFHQGFFILRLSTRQALDRLPLSFSLHMTTSKVVKGAPMVSFIGNIVRNIVNDHARQCRKFRGISSSLDMFFLIN